MFQSMQVDNIMQKRPDSLLFVWEIFLAELCSITTITICATIHKNHIHVFAE